MHIILNMNETPKQPIIIKRTKNAIVRTPVEHELVKHPITGKYMDRNSPSIQKEIGLGTIDYDGKLLISVEELEERKQMMQFRKNISQGRLCDAVDSYKSKLTLMECLFIIKQLEAEIRSEKRDEDFEALLNETKENIDMVKEIAKRRKAKFTLE